MLFFLILFAPQADQVTFRIITVRTEGEASELRARILASESFEAVARERSTDSSAPAGGFAGTFAPADLQQELQTALSGLSPRQISPVLKMGNEFFLFQLAAPAEAEWTRRRAICVLIDATAPEV